MKTYGGVVGVEPMVEKVLTKEDMLLLYAEYIDHLEYCKPMTYPAITAIINNVTYHNWDGVDHDGILILVKDSADDKGDYYFAERTWSFGENQVFTSYMAGTPVWHALLPIDITRSKELSLIRHRRHMLNLRCYGIDTKELADLIIDRCIVDDITLPMSNERSRFDINDIEEIRHFESVEKKKIYNEWKDNAVKRLMNGDVPAGDELWDELCIGQLASERVKVFEALWKKGHHAYLDGERDSFGWVTCGIVMNGQLMTSTYF